MSRVGQRPSSNPVPVGKKAPQTTQAAPPPKSEAKQTSSSAWRPAAKPAEDGKGWRPEGATAKATGGGNRKAEVLADIDRGLAEIGRGLAKLGGGTGKATPKASDNRDNWKGEMSDLDRRLDAVKRDMEAMDQELKRRGR